MGFRQLVQKLEWISQIYPPKTSKMNGHFIGTHQMVQKSMNNTNHFYFPRQTKRVVTLYRVSSTGSKVRMNNTIISTL